MCWITSKEIHNEPKIAEEDIKVKKILTKQLTSPYMGNPWVMNEVQKTNLGGCCCYNNGLVITSWCVSEGFHSCKNIIQSTHPFKRSFYSASEDGEIYGNVFPNCAEKDYLVFDAIIPKGSMYYVNEYEEFVSNKLMITGIAEQRKQSITPKLPFF